MTRRWESGASKLQCAVPSSESSFLDCELFHKVRPGKSIAPKAEIVNTGQGKENTYARMRAGTLLNSSLTCGKVYPTHSEPVNPTGRVAGGDSAGNHHFQGQLPADFAGVGKHGEGEVSGTAFSVGSPRLPWCKA